MAFMRTIAYVQMIMATAFFFLFTIANFLYNTFAEKLARKVQVEYFEACLHKDAAFYDDPKQVPTEMPSKIASETEAIKAGMGDKNDQIWSTLFMSLGGFAVGFTLGPELAGICMGFLPVFACGTAMIMGGYAKGLIEIKKSYSQSAGYAEQALQAIKVVHTYGQEKLEARNYGKYLTRSYEAQQKFNGSMAFGIAFFMSLIFVFYGYSFFFGGLLRVNGVSNAISGTYTGGTIISVMNCIMIGCWSISSIFTNAQVLMDARIAARMAYDVIDKEVEVDSKAPGIEVTNDTLRGDIEFKNVNFSYPTRANLKVMVDFSINIEAGKTTALVGPSGSGKSTII
jgi:ABC-type multidrug transport system fused ATPase/permease subunit